MPALATDKFKKLSKRWVGQIGAAGVTDGVTGTVPLASVTNLPTDTAVVAVIDRVDANGTATPTVEETVIGVVSGSNLANCVRGAEGTAGAHNAGAVVEILVTAKGWNDLVDGLLVSHTQLGYIAASAITASMISASAITANTLAASAVIAGNMAASSVLAHNLAASSVILGNLAASSVSQGNLNFSAGGLSVKAGQLTHDISTTGTQAITGVGFTPKAVIFVSVISATAHATSIGIDDGASHQGIYDDNSRTAGRFSLTDSPGVYSIILTPNADVTATSASAYISAFGADGFTLTWAKTGSPTGTATIGYLAIG